MNPIAILGSIEKQPSHSPSAFLFGGAALTLEIFAAALAVWIPLQFSIFIVFLFAGPHNWIEARYFLERLPARWGRLRNFFLLSSGGIIGLTTAYAALPWLAQRWDWNVDVWTLSFSVWNSVTILWVAALVNVRSRQKPYRNWSWTLPVAFTFTALAWIAPQWWNLALVYLHPIMALWILDRELCRSRPEWRHVYHACLASLPIGLSVIWLALVDAPPLSGAGDLLTARIAQHAGADIFPGVSPHLLVATHTFLEMLHYGVWLVAIPWVGLRDLPWRLDRVRVARGAGGWRKVFAGVLITTAGFVVLLWAGFLADYLVTRDVYFTVAMFHVLAEVPFLLRAL